jgi:hypothetical protein
LTPNAWRYISDDIRRTVIILILVPNVGPFKAPATKLINEKCYRERTVLAVVMVSPVLNFLPTAMFFRNVTRRRRLVRDYYITK